MEIAKKTDLKSKIKIKSREISKEIIIDGKVINIDKSERN